MDDQIECNRLAFHDPLTVQYIARLHGEILAKFQECDALVLEIPPETPADLSAVQLILAARRYASTHAKQFALANPASGPLRDVLERSGFLENRSGETHKFWLHSEGNE